MEYSGEECLSALEKARDKLEKSPSKREYQKLNLSPSAHTIAERFGSWNKAKEKAGLKFNQFSNEVEPKPDNIDIPNDKDWESISAYQRYYYKNKKQEILRTTKRKKEIIEWFKKYKSNLECENCGEDHSACLDFHHSEEKETSVSDLVRNTTSSISRIKKEIDKCQVLCANCHRKAHSQANMN